MSERRDARVGSARPAAAGLPFAPTQRCWSCGDPITPFQATGQNGICDRMECRSAAARRLLEEDRRLEAERREAAAAALRDTGLNPEEAAWSLTPANPAGPVPLSPERRRAFLAHLRWTVEEAVAPEGRTRPDAATEEDEGRFGPPGEEEREALTAGCAACRGWCCRRGGTHAFLEATRIRRLLRDRPDLAPAELPDLYASFLGEEHLEGGCVFQGEAGCRLPRDLRSDTCERYHCPDLAHARRRWRRDGGGTHHFVALLSGRAEAPRIGAGQAPDLRPHARDR